MTYSFLFLISSSINHFMEEKFSRNTKHERYLQTLETIESIRNKVPNSKICLFELSQSPIDNEYRHELTNRVENFLEFYNDTDITTLYHNFTVHPELFKYGKSLLELNGLIKTLKFIDNEYSHSQFNRIFKITGRYLLNNSFNIEDYQTKFLKDKYVIKHLKFSEYEPTTNVHYHVFQNKGSVVTALWSFDMSLFYETIDLLDKSFDYLQRMLLYTPGNDIEHSIYHFIDKNKLINCDFIGVSIRKGMEIDDYNT